MANTYPLKPIHATQYTGKSPMATTDEAAKYRAMLGTQAASEDVGLFYQLNQVAKATDAETTASTSTTTTGT